MRNSPVIFVQGLKKTFAVDGVEVHALDGVNFSIERGEFVAIMGPSGSGKSTLMHLLGCLDTPSEGVYKFREKDVSMLPPDELAALRNSNIGFVFQDFNLLPRISACENVETPLLFNRSSPAFERKKRVSEALRKVGLWERQSHLPTQLSGGEKQRVAIARALVNRPEVILADEPTGNLDSKNGAEIMNFLRALNSQGITVVVITHDPAVAAYARRKITLSDGKIVSDELQTLGIVPPFNAIPHDPEPPPTTEKEKTGFFSKLLDLPLLFSGITQGWCALEKNPFRSFLTTLGILIGIWSVISIGGIGKSFYVGFRDKVLLLNRDAVYVYPYSYRKTAKGSVFNKGILTESDARALSKNLKDFAVVSPIITSTGKASFEKREMEYLLFRGVDWNYLEILNRSLKSGRFFSEGEVKKASRVCVITENIAKELFPDRGALSQEVSLRGIPFMILGVLRQEQYEIFSGGDAERSIFLPFSTIKRELSKDENPGEVERIEILVRNPEDIARVDFQTRRILKWSHNIRGNREEDFRVRNTLEISMIIAAMFSGIVFVFLIIGAISLIVGGIGVMNIMLVSVAERTREIGILMAVGARRLDVLFQILIESLTVSAIGGLIGAITGILTALLVQFGFESALTGFCNIGISELLEMLGRFFQFPIISLFMVFFALGVSAFTGVFFGAYPAWKASNLDPIKALRTL